MFRFDNTFARLPRTLYSRVRPVPVIESAMVIFNHELAEEIELTLDDPDAFAVVGSGNSLPEGADPIAQAYAGHQFGHFTMLGDGRAVLLGEQITSDGRRVDVQLKGSGKTPYSRGGDGRGALGPMLREYLISEAMYALGIPTTRSLAVVSTGEMIERETPLPGAVLTRVASSHLRVGTVEYVAALGDRYLLDVLVRYALRRHFSEMAGADNPALALLQGVLERQAELVARWMSVGFVHGVMNTDNMTLSGETIDYGPCAFMDLYDPSTVFSSIDTGGRYALGNQPAMAQWNLARLAKALLPLLGTETSASITAAEAALDAFVERFRFHYLSLMRLKLGMLTCEEEDFRMIMDLLSWMKDTESDFTRTFSALTRVAASGSLDRELCFQKKGFSNWYARWTVRIGRQGKNSEEIRARMRRANPVVIPRNHHVEAALEAAVCGDGAMLQRLLSVLQYPFDEIKENEPYREGPPLGTAPYRTFCGT